MENSFIEFTGCRKVPPRRILNDINMKEGLILTIVDMNFSSEHKRTKNGRNRGTY